MHHELAAVLVVLDHENMKARFSRGTAVIIRALPVAAGIA
jgi:hypothetical protein